MAERPSAQSFAPVQFKSLRQQVRATLRNAILDGTLAAGSRILEAQIAAEMGISRAPVREALRQLESEGLVRTEPQRGTFVSVPSSITEHIQELYSLRAVLEGLAARILVERNTGLAPLQEVLDKLHAAARTRDHTLMITYDVQFHRVMCELAGHSLLNATRATIESQMSGLSESILPMVVDDLPRVVRIHGELLAALESGDADAAEKAARRHVLNSLARLMQRQAAQTEKGGERKGNA